jgi:hypothetical protein
VSIPTPSNAPDTPASFDSLKFNPVGLYDLRRRQGVLQSPRGIFNKYQSKFLASDIAWFAAGIHNDGQHQVPPGHFHPAFLTAREGTTYEERTNLRKKGCRPPVRYSKCSF